jgi:hypothetical protein
VLAAALGVALIATSCGRAKRDVGALCRSATAETADLVRGVCLDDRTFVSCDHEHVEIPCRGPKGCHAAGAGWLHLSCDMSANADGDPCVWSNRHHGQCGLDGKSLVECAFSLQRPAHTARIPCRGPRGCVDDGKDEPTCDDSVGVEGEPCTTGGACSADQSVLRCDLPPPPNVGAPGRWVVQQRCRGPNGCKRVGHADGNGYSVTCDDVVAVEGDPCPFDGASACNLQGTAQLECRGHRMVLFRPCRCTTERYGDHTSSVTCEGR